MNRGQVAQDWELVSYRILFGRNTKAEKNVQLTTSRDYKEDNL